MPNPRAGRVPEEIRGIAVTALYNAREEGKVMDDAAEAVAAALLDEFEARLTSEEARHALYDAHMHYQARAPHEQDEDDWTLALIDAAFSIVKGEE